MTNPGEDMSEEEKKLQEACERICGERGKRDMHSSAPEICPILEQQWKNPKRRLQYG